MYNDELKHYGVIGMKWGVRRYEDKNGRLTAAGKARYANSGEAKAAYKQAKRDARTARNEYGRAFNKAYNRRIAAFSPSKKARQRNEERWKDAADKAEASNAAKKNLKQARKDYKQAKAIEKNEARLKKHEALAGKETVDRVRAQSTGKTLAQSYVFGTYGALKYNQARAAGAGRGKAAVNGVLYAYGNALTFNTMQFIEPRMKNRR